jgi:peptidoglycan/xylan/chitin deacetylase (PgdA/CDA1 family)/SAM-dependent methyltransferase
MSARIATIVRCADQIGQVYATVASVKRQTTDAGVLVLVTDPSTPRPACDWLHSFAGRERLLVAHADVATPGAVRNAGIRAVTAAYIMCIDAGDRVDPRCHEAAAAKLDAERTVDVVTSSVLVLGPGAETNIIGASGHDIDALVADTEAIHSAAMFRRTAWASLGGFDESLSTLEAYDFWLRLLHSGRRAAVVDLPLVVRTWRDDGLYRRAWESVLHKAAVEQIVARHATIFRRDPAAALYSRERILRQLGDQYRSAVKSRDDGVRELEALKARVAALRGSLPENERDGVDLGDLRRTAPVARGWGYERGRPIDRYYIERFLEGHAGDIRGTVLEVQEPDYTTRFGGNRVTRSDVLDLNAGNPRATILSDLRSASNIAANTYDCIILTQTLHVVDDMEAVVGECHRILKPGGVLLATLPAASRVCLEYGRDGDFWRVTEAGARRLIARTFPSEGLDVRARGNVLVNSAFLYGLACHELTDAEFEAVDPYFPLLVTVRAQKTPSPAVRVQEVASPAIRSAGLKACATNGNAALKGCATDVGAILLYHRVAAPKSDVHRLSTPPDHFRAQMEYVVRNCRPMPLAELAAAARDRRLEARSVAVTFDDGYVDNYTQASAILSALGVPATFFVTTDRLDDSIEYWWDALEDILLSPDARRPAHLDIALPGGRRAFSTRTPDERLAAHTEIYHAIVGAPAVARDEVIEKLARWSGRRRSGSSTHRRMKAEEVRDLAKRSGHSIGAHTARHLMLPRQSVAVQRQEIDGSRRALEVLLDRPVRSFAYPFGAFSDETVGEVRTASFDVAVTCEDAVVAADADPLRLPRLDVNSRSVADFDEWLTEKLKVKS